MNFEVFAARVRQSSWLAGPLRGLYTLIGLPRSIVVSNIKKNQPKTVFSKDHLKDTVVLPNRLEMIKRMPENSIAAELGVDEGQFSKDMLSTGRVQELHLVDLWGSVRYSEKKMKDVQTKLAAQSKTGQVHFHRAKSVDAASEFEDAFFDFVYIDTDHSYTTTANELTVWAPKVKPGGYLLGHDFVDGNLALGVKYGVIEAVAEFVNREDWVLAYVTMDHLENQSFGLCRSDWE